MKEFKNDRELLEEIHSWLCFIQQPSKKDTEDLRRDIKNHLEKKVSQIEPPVMLNFAEDDLANQVKQDIENRIIKGVDTYGERLKPFNGRVALQDAYEEILDLALYIKQELKERESKISA